MKHDASVQELAGAIADGQDVDWDGALKDTAAPQSTVVENLSRIARLMSAHQHLVREHLPFETWGKLRLLEKIGEGGFGEVYRAWDESLGREVALKLFRQKQEGDSVRGTMSSRQAEDLMLEARRLARVRHEHVVSVYGAEEHRHRAGFWMELVGGQTLASLMHAEGRMDPAEAAHIGLKLCGGLAAIHRAGLLHRDIKAQNVMRDADGRIVLTDMGAGVDLRFTSSGLPRSIAGTPLYMAPELMEGREADHRADIYSLGVLLYHLVTGRFPYESHSYAELKEDHRADRRVKVTERRPDLSTEFVEVVERATAHDPRNRYASAADFEAALRPLAADPEWAPAPSSSRPRPWLIALLVVVLVVAGAWLGRDVLAPSGPATNAGPTAELGQTRRLTFSGNANVPLWSPDGRWIAYTEGGQIRITTPDGGESRGLEYPDGRSGIAWNWSPDSRSLLCHSYNADLGALQLVQVDALTGDTKVLVDDGYFGALSPDGEKLVYAQFSPGNQIHIASRNLETGREFLLVRADEPGTAVYKPRFFPDGERVAYTKWAGWGHELWFTDLEGRTLTQIPTSPLRPGGQYDITPDGKYILVGAELYGVGSVWKIAVDGSSRVPLTSGGAVQDMVSLGPDGQSFCFAKASHTSRLAYLDLASGETRFPARLDLAMRQPMISSDGSRLYFQALVNGIWQIWQAPLDTPGSTRAVIARDSVSCFAPAPGSDGILHLRGVVPNTSIFGRIDWGQTLWSTTEDGGRHEPWPSAGEQVFRLAAGGERGGRVLYTRAGGGGEAFMVTDREGPAVEIDRDDDEHEILQFDWGRSANEVVLVTTRGDSTILEALDLENGARSPLLTPSMLPFDADARTLRSCRALATAPDGSFVALLLVDRQQSLTRVVALHTSDGTVETLTDFSGDQLGQHLAWAPDGDGLAITLSRSSKDIYIWEPQRGAKAAATVSPSRP